MSDRELINAALLWHSAYERRLVVGATKRKLQAQLKAGGDGAWSLNMSLQEIDAGRQLTELKRRELAALRALAKICGKQRRHLQAADVIDMDGAMVLLAADAPDVATFTSLDGLNS